MAGPEEDWAALLRLAIAGDKSAYHRFLTAVTPTIRGIVRARGTAGARGLDAAQCEDVVQEVLLAIHLKRHTWRQDAPLRPWLYAITRHKVVDAFRARGARIDLPVEDFSDVLADETATDPTEQADILKMIGLLDQRSAQIVRLIGIEGASAAEAGNSLSMSEGAVRVALHRAFRTLAQLRERHLQ